jgi:hypothetical protein
VAMATAAVTAGILAGIVAFDPLEDIHQCAGRNTLEEVSPCRVFQG